jgi:hypothetical protein
MRPGEAKRELSTIVFVNNAISARMAEATLARDGVSLETVALFVLRTLHRPWFDECGVVIPYPRRPSLSRLGQIQFAGYYARAASWLRTVLNRDKVRSIYLINSDNLLTNHALQWAESHPEASITVLAEGLMNYQDIQLRNRASWRGRMKSFISPVLGLRWRAPVGHLSGAFESSVRRVVGFAPGLVAPREKVELIPFAPVTASCTPRADTVLVAYTGLCQWMSGAKFTQFADAFVAWLRTQNFNRVLVKPHPHYSVGSLASIMPPHAVVEDARSLEDMAADIEAATVVSFNCTALVTLRMLRPDLTCIDFGHDFYGPEAYFGDRSCESLLRESGVVLVPMLSESA